MQNRPTASVTAATAYPPLSPLVASQPRSGLHAARYSSPFTFVCISLKAYWPQIRAEHIPVLHSSPLLPSTPQQRITYSRHPSMPFMFFQGGDDVGSQLQSSRHDEMCCCHETYKYTSSIPLLSLPVSFSSFLHHTTQRCSRQQPISASSSSSSLPRLHIALAASTTSHPTSRSYPPLPQLDTS